MTRLFFQTLLVVFVLSLFAVPAHSQNLPYNGQTNIGLYGGANINMQPSFTVPEPINFVNNKNATDVFFHIGAIGNFPISELITISGRLGYNGMRGDFTNASSELSTSLDYFEINPNVQLHNLIKDVPLYFLLGVELGVPMSAKYDFTTNPADLTNVTNQDIPDKNFRLAAALGVGYVFDLGKNFYFAPEASFRLPFSEVSSNNNWGSWTVPQLRIGFALTYGFGGDKAPEVVVVPGVELEVGFKEVRYYDRQKNPNPLKKITVEETQYSELFPLVPYVFFKEKTATVNESTNLAGKRQAGEFSIKELPADAMMINSQLLDVVGTRMNENAASKIKLIGTLDMQNEKDVVLAKERAEFARKYLVETYRINPSRIETATANLPAKASSSKIADGIEENRRVEVATSNGDLIAPIVIESERQRISDPDLVEFITYAKSNEELKEWSLEIKQAGRVVRQFNGKGEPKPIQWQIVPNELTASQVPLDYTFTAKTVSGASKYASASVPVEYFSFTRKKTEEKPDRTISKFSLTLFDFDSPNISDGDKNILNMYVLPSIKFNSTVQIYGYTDRIGEDAYNKKLARDRAESVKKFLEAKAKGSKYEIFGVGENEVIFDNNNPVGRHLSRTVQIYVSTPKN